MAKRNRFKAQPITPVTGMREYLGDGSFLMTVLVMALFAFIHQRVSAAELEYGGGGIWCVLGVPAGFCLLISSAIACLGARTKLLPAIAPILGLGGVAASLVMFFIIAISRFDVSGGMLGAVQEIAMLAFIGVWLACVLLLMLTGIGMKVPPAAGTAAAVITIIAMILFAVRAMYIFSSLVTALSRNLLLPDGEMADSIRWVLRSVAPGSEGAVRVYFDRMLDCIATVLLMLCCIPLAMRFNALFSEQAVNMKNARDIPRPTEHHRVYTGYDEYTQDVPAENTAGEAEFTVTSEGYYVEKKITDRAKFKRRERGERSAAEKAEAVPDRTYEPDEARPHHAPGDGESYDDYVPGAGWVDYMHRTAPAVQEAAPEPKRVKPVRIEPPAPDPKNEDIWNKYRK